MEKKRVPTIIEGKDIMADVDYTLAAESMPITPEDMAKRLIVPTKGGNLRHLGTENFNFTRISEEERQQMPILEKNSYTPKQMERTLAKMMIRLYGIDNLRTLQANPQQYKKFYWQHEYDLVKNNPIWMHLVLVV